MKTESGWPKISIVIFSDNQAQFLERTVRSVLTQSYHNAEYIVMDGGSTDGSVDILRKYGSQPTTFSRPWQPMQTYTIYC